MVFVSALATKYAHSAKINMSDHSSSTTVASSQMLGISLPVESFAVFMFPAIVGDFPLRPPFHSSVQFTVESSLGVAN